jgi:hypothetical protein
MSDVRPRVALVTGAARGTASHDAAALHSKFSALIHKLERAHFSRTAGPGSGRPPFQERTFA